MAVFRFVLADMIRYIVAISVLNSIDLTETILRKDKAVAGWMLFTSQLPLGTIGR